MKAVVIGATGFVGRNVVNELIKMKIEVIAVDKEMSDIPEEWEDRVVCVNIDMFDENGYDELLKYRADIFFHFAWAGVSKQMRGNIDMQMDNVKYSCMMLRCCKKMGCSKFVFAGSTTEYEAMEYLRRDGIKPAMSGVYGISKLTADFLLKTLAEELQVEYVNVLISNVYGEGDKSTRFINTVLKKMFNDEKIEFTHCEQLYDFIYITDATKAIITAGLKGKTMSTYYIGTTKQYPLKHYVEMIRSITKSNSVLLYDSIPYNNAMLSYKEFDTLKIEKEFGVNCEYSFEEGIKKTISWIKKERNL